jgi:hypothetical protein
MGSGEPLVMGAGPVANQAARVLGSPRDPELGPPTWRTLCRRVEEFGTRTDPMITHPTSVAPDRHGRVLSAGG